MLELREHVIHTYYHHEKSAKNILEFNFAYLAHQKSSHKLSDFIRYGKNAISTYYITTTPLNALESNQLLYHYALRAFSYCL